MKTIVVHLLLFSLFAKANEPGFILQPWNRVDLGDPKEVTFNWLASIVKIHGKTRKGKENGNGNGLFISPQHILTAYHITTEIKCEDLKLDVLSSPTMAEIKTPQKRSFKCKKYILEDKEKDISIIEIKPFYSPNFVPIQRNFPTVDPDKIFLAGYYPNNFLWISKDCKFFNIGADTQTVRIVTSEITRTYEPGTLKTAICPGEPGISGTVLMGAKGGKYIPLGVYSATGSRQRKIKVNSDSRIIDDQGKGQSIIQPDESCPSCSIAAGSDGASEVGSFPMLSDPIWKTHKKVWNEVIEAIETNGEKP